MHRTLLALAICIFAAQASFASPRLVALSQDGKIIAKTGSNKADLWKPDAVLPSLTFTQNVDIISVAISKDGSRAVTANSQGTIIVWDAPSGQQLLSFDAPSGLKTMALSHDGQRIATGGQDQSTRLWDAKLGKLVWEQKYTTSDELGVLSLAFSDSDNLLAATGATFGKIYETTSGKETDVLPGEIVAFLANDSEVAITLSALGELWNTMFFVHVTGAPHSRHTRAPSVKGSASLGSSIAPNGKAVAAGYFPGSALAIWDPSDVSPSNFKMLAGDDGGISSLMFSFDSAFLVTWSAATNIIVWDAASGRRLRTLSSR